MEENFPDLEAEFVFVNAGSRVLRELAKKLGYEPGGAAQSKALATMARRSSGLPAPQRERTPLPAT
jgi:hypothetical protein